MQVLIQPCLNPAAEIDLTEPLIAAIAEQLWIHCGGNAELNWIEAEAHLKHLLGSNAGEVGGQARVGTKRRTVSVRRRDKVAVRRPAKRKVRERTRAVPR